MNKTKLFLGQKIQALRKLNNYTQEQLAEKVNRSKNHISKIELGTANPPLDLLISISEALYVDISELFDYGKDKDTISCKKELTNAINQASDKHLRLLFDMHKNLTSENIL